MKCRYPLERRTKDWAWHSLPCGRCLPCRITRRSALVLRCLAEGWKSSTQSFWTCTLADHSLEALNEEHYRATIKRFVQSLQASERRAQNSLPIRYIGCIEYGSDYGRPHLHVLIWNLMRNYRRPPQYLAHLKGLPRPRHAIPQWPHGHVDIAEVNLSTMHYVMSYMLDFSHLKTPHRPPAKYVSTRRPGIGAYGMRQVGWEIARSHSTVSMLPGSISLKGRHFPMGTWSKQQVLKGFTDAGGLIRPEGTPLTRYRSQMMDVLAIQNATPVWYRRRREADESKKATAILDKVEKAEKRWSQQVALAEALAKERQNCADPDGDPDPEGNGGDLPPF